MMGSDFCGGVSVSLSAMVTSVNVHCKYVGWGVAGKDKTGVFTTQRQDAH